MFSLLSRKLKPIHNANVLLNKVLKKPREIITYVNINKLIVVYIILY